MVIECVSVNTCYFYNSLVFASPVSILNTSLVRESVKLKSSRIPLITLIIDKTNHDYKKK